MLNNRQVTQMLFTLIWLDLVSSSLVWFELLKGFLVRITSPGQPVALPHTIHLLPTFWIANPRIHGGCFGVWRHTSWEAL